MAFWITTRDVVQQQNDIFRRFLQLIFLYQGLLKGLIGHSHQLSGLHEELVELVRVALVQEGLGRVLEQNGDRVADLPEQSQEIQEVP